MMIVAEILYSADTRLHLTIHIEQLHFISIFSIYKNQKQEQLFKIDWYCELIHFVY